MTFRDCTLFVQVPRELVSASEEEASLSDKSDQGMNHTPNFSCTNSLSKPRRIRIVISDLDEKSEANRGEYWKSLERELITGGYYLGRGKLDANAEDCDLRDVVRTSDQVKWNGYAG
jgi:Inositol-pentakisphosphate 2-kinase